MNRFFRTAYATTFAYLFLAMIAALITGIGMPFLAFVCLYLGLLVVLLPSAMPKLRGREALFLALGALTALLGFLTVFLYLGRIIHYIAHGLGIFAAAVFVNTLKHRTTHSDFAAKFRFSVVLIFASIAIIYLALIFGITEGSMLPIQTEYVRQAVDHVVPIAIMLLITGVLLLRGLRGLHGMVDEKAFNRRQLRDVLIYAVIVSFVFIINPFRYLMIGVGWLYESVLRPAVRWLIWAFDQLLELLSNKKPRFDTPTPEATPDPSEYIMPLPETMFTEQDPEHYIIDEAGEKRAYRTIMYIFLAAAAVVLLVILILEIRKMVRKIRSRDASRGRGYPNEIREALEETDSVRKSEKLKKRSSNPRIRIRYLYSEFLRYLRHIPIRIESSDTCGEINERTEKLLRVSGEDLSEFRSIYEQTRYSASLAPTDQDAARMKTLFDRLKKGRQ